MKKRKKLILCILAVVVMLAVAFVGCTGCTPTPEPTPQIKYAVTPIADLTDYSSTANEASKVYTVNADYTEARNNLEAKIKTQKSYYDAYADVVAGTGDGKYLKYTATDLEDGTEDVVDGEQSSLLKILAHADADQLIYVLGYSGLEQNKMISLITYIAEDGENAKANPKAATGLIEDYEAIREWNDEIDTKGTSTSEGQTAYKNRARKSRAMNKRLFDTGMNGGDAGRVALEVSEYIQVVTEAMRETYNAEHSGAVLDNMTEYFKKELLDYDTVVLIRANNDRRWGTAGQGKGAMNKEVVYSVAERSYAGSYRKPSTEDAALVKAYGYSFEYERGNYNALSDEDFEKELTYRFKDNMSNDEAKDYSRIQRAQYEKAFRYSYEFYTKYYEALNPINVAQEKYEGAVFGFTNIDRAAGDPFYGASNIIEVQGVGGDVTEEIISVDLGGNNAGSYASMTYNALQVGLKDQLIAGDMQHYYWSDDAHIIAQNGANNDRMSSDSGTQAKGNFNLKLVNIKMADFVLSTFVSEKNPVGLSNIMKAQTRLYIADYSRMVKAFRRQVVRELATLQKEGVLVAGMNGNNIKYSLAANKSYTPEQQDAVRDNIGRASVMINILDGNRQQVSSNLSNRETTITKTDWNTIADQINKTATCDYDKEANSTVAWGKKSKIFDDLLIKKKTDENGNKVLDSNGREQYDEHWETSLFVSNNSNVLAYSSGQIKVNFQVATAVTASGVVSSRAPYGDIYGYSGDTVKTIIDSQNYDDNNIAQGISFAKVSNGNGTQYEANYAKFYLKREYTAANPTNGTPESEKCYYEVNASDVMDYDIMLYVVYVPVA